MGFAPPGLRPPIDAKGEDDTGGEERRGLLLATRKRRWLPVAWLFMPGGNKVPRLWELRSLRRMWVGMGNGSGSPFMGPEE